MNELELQTLVSEAVALHREITIKNEQLKALKAGLVREARLRPLELELTNRGGKRWTAEGTDGCIARVNFPACSLLADIDGEDDMVQQLRTIAGVHFRKLFATVKSYQLVENFRVEAAALLPAPKATALTKLCESESQPRVSFETADCGSETPAS